MWICWESGKTFKCQNLKKDGYYAFVCEKCAPVFGHYGYFLTEIEEGKKLISENHLDESKIVVHAPYIINLSNPIKKETTESEYGNYAKE